MNWDQFVVASDGSVAGQHAEGYARALADKAKARLVCLNVQPKQELVTSGAGWTETPTLWETAHAVAHGVPSVEICRYAEGHGASLLVLGHKARTEASRLMLGDTADAVARRSLVPTLHVPVGQHSFRRMLVALDGTERGMTVARTATSFATALGLAVDIVTVEAGDRHAHNGNGVGTSNARTLQLIEAVSAMGFEQPLVIRHGDPAEEIATLASELGADLLAVGYRRGGPPAVIEAGSVARRLVHAAPCAVLAVPL